MICDIMPKIKPNEKCPCDSGKKYKKCCAAEMLRLKQQARDLFATYMNELPSKFDDERLQRVHDMLADRYRIQSLNASAALANWPLQKVNDYYKNQSIMLIAARNGENDAAFRSKTKNDEDIFMIYRGKYQLFKYETEFDKALDAVKAWM